MARAALPIVPSISRNGDRPCRLTRPMASRVRSMMRCRTCAGKAPSMMHGLDVDHRDGGDDANRRGFRRLRRSIRRARAEVVAPVVGRLPEDVGIAALGHQLALEHVDRGDVHQLRAAGRHRSPPLGRHRAEGPAHSGCGRGKVAVEHQPAADEGADEDVEIVDVVAAAAEHQLGGAGGGDVVGEIDRPGADARRSRRGCRLCARRRSPPWARRSPRARSTSRRARAMPSPAMRARVRLWRSSLEQLVDAGAGELADAVGRGVGVGLVQEPRGSRR